MFLGIRASSRARSRRSAPNTSGQFGANCNIRALIFFSPSRNERLILCALDGRATGHVVAPLGKPQQSAPIASAIRRARFVRQKKSLERKRLLLLQFRSTANALLFPSDGSLRIASNCDPLFIRLGKTSLGLRNDFAICKRRSPGLGGLL